MATSTGDESTRSDRAREVGLFRYALIREAADSGLSTRVRGRLVRDLAGREHAGPFGARVRVSRVTIDRWILAWRRGGFDALVPVPRNPNPVTAAAVLELAASLKREVPARTAAQVQAILQAQLHAGVQAGSADAHDDNSGPESTEGPVLSVLSVPSVRTLQRHFVRLELNTRPNGVGQRVFGRFEAAAPNDMWTGDALHGPVIAAVRRTCSRSSMTIAAP